MRLQQNDRVVMYGTVRKVGDDLVTVELDGSATSAVVRKTAVVIETMLRDGEDWPHCVCNNTPDMDGFSSCTEEGIPIEPAGDWDGKLYVCLRCGRVFDQETRIVTRHADIDQVILDLDP